MTSQEIYAVLTAKWYQEAAIPNELVTRSKVTRMKHEKVKINSFKNKMETIAIKLNLTEEREENLCSFYALIGKKGTISSLKEEYRKC